LGSIKPGLKKGRFDPNENGRRSSASNSGGSLRCVPKRDGPRKKGSDKGHSFAKICDSSTRIRRIEKEADRPRVKWG